MVFVNRALIYRTYFTQLRSSVGTAPLAFPLIPNIFFGYRNAVTIQTKLTSDLSL